MDLHDEAVRARLHHHLGGLVRDRRSVCGVAPLAGLVDWVNLLRASGAQRPLLASAVGAGATPDPDDADVVFLDVPEAPSMTEELRRHDDDVVRHLPDDVVAAIEAYDPDRTAAWLVGPFVSTEPVLGREVLTGRPDAWTALEDKPVADDLWDAVGAPRAGSRVVLVDPDALQAASDDLADGTGVVWAGDARDGFNGGGDYVRWVVSEADAVAAHDVFAPRCDRVRVMPFLDGVPCSIHGMVLPDATAVFRPVELAILRRADRTFVYGGLGTSWDPPERDREQMRDLARHTGEHLRRLVGYRGAFGVDGILTVDGFRPTELNARLSGGLTSLARAADPDLVNLLQFNLLAGRDPGVDAATLERWAVSAMDAERFVKAIALAPQRVTADPVDVLVAWDGSTLRRADQDTGWQVSAAPNPAGTFARLTTPGAPDETAWRTSTWR